MFVGEGMRRVPRHFDPRDADRLGREMADARRIAEVTAELEHAEKVSSKPTSPPVAIEGTWRDGRGHSRPSRAAPQPVARGRAPCKTGETPVTTAEATFSIGGGTRDGRQWLNVLFQPDAEGEPQSSQIVRAVLGQLTGCGRFSEMTIARGDEDLPLLGMRIFSAVVETPRPASKAPLRRTESAKAKMIERAKPLLAELVARARDSKEKPARLLCTPARRTAPRSRA